MKRILSLAVLFLGLVFSAHAELEEEHSNSELEPEEVLQP